MKTYEFDGEKYKTASSHQKEWGNRLLQNSYEALKADGILLWDFGSKGNFSNFLTVIGIFQLLMK